MKNHNKPAKAKNKKVPKKTRSEMAHHLSLQLEKKKAENKNARKVIVNVDEFLLSDEQIRKHNINHIEKKLNNLNELQFFLEGLTTKGACAIDSDHIRAVAYAMGKIRQELQTLKNADALNH